MNKFFTSLVFLQLMVVGSVCAQITIMYPYTWDFTVPADGDVWTTSRTQFQEEGWTLGDQQYTRNTSISNSTVEIVKGLSFTGYISVAWPSGWNMWSNGTITVPDLKLGQKVVITHNNGTVSASNGAWSDNNTTFIVTRDGSVTFNTSDCRIQSICVTNDEDKFFFTPSSGKLNSGGCWIKPITEFSNNTTPKEDDVTSITGISSNTSVATIPSNLKVKGTYYTRNGAGEVSDLRAPITSVNAGTANILIVVKKTDGTYQVATYQVEVTNGTAPNFYWKANGPTGDQAPIYVYEGDFIMLPELVGNANGNDSFSNPANKKYVYGIKNGVVEWNSKDKCTYKIGEGVPDISTTDLDADGGRTTNPDRIAYIFFGDGASNADDSLMIYGNKAGTTFIRARDPQTGQLCKGLKLTVLPKSTIDNAHTSAVNGMWFPYTWDFTNMDMTDIEAEINSQCEGTYWRNSDGSNNYYMADGLFNADYDDKNNNSNYAETNDKIVTANQKYMKAFNGLKIRLVGRQYWKQKHDRLRIAKDGSHICFIGGRHAIVFPNPEKKPTNPYKLFIKGKGTSGTKKSNFISLTDADQSDVNYQFDRDETKIVSFNASDLVNNTIYVNNMHIDWIAFSTQAKHISSVNYATYSEKYDLDFEKTKEAQGVQTFGVSSTGDNKAYLTELKYAKATEGFVIKNAQENKDQAADYYYISIARNLDNYADRYGSYDLNGDLVNNMLVGTPGNTTIADYKETGDVYFLSNQSYVEDENGQEVAGTQANYLGFFKAARSKTHSNAYSAFLLIPPSAGAKYFLLPDFDDTDFAAPTSIDNGITSDEAAGDGYYYNLNGMRVEKPAKGVYVRNGKKVIIK